MSVRWFGFSLLPLPTARPPACPTPGSHCNGRRADSCKDGASPAPSSGWRGPGRRPGLCSRRRPEKGRARPGVWLASATGAHWRAGRGAQPPSGALTGEHPAARPSQEQRCPHCSGCTGLRGAGFGPAAGGGQGQAHLPTNACLCGAGDPQVDCFNCSGTADPSPSEPGTSAPVAAVQMHPRAPRKGRPGLDRDAPGRARQLGPGDDPRPSPRL